MEEGSFADGFPLERSTLEPQVNVDEPLHEGARM